MSGPPTAVLVDDDQLILPDTVDPDATYDVLLNDVHVWSLLPSRDATPSSSGPVARWPKALRKHLQGRATVVLRDHVGGAVLARTEHVFGDDPGREVSVTDKHGHGLVLDKWGRLTRPLSAEEDGVVGELLAEVARLLDDLQEVAGVPGFVSYGTLLGAVRDGALIGHDNDIDVSYVSLEPYPVDVVREGYRVERALRDAGWSVRRGSGTRLNVRLPLSDGGLRFVDVFTAHWVDGVVYMPSDTGFALPHETFLPLGTVTLHGREVPAPRDPETLLAHTYGEGWRVPDPSFKYETPTWLTRRIGGWFGGLMTHRKHWDGFYNTARDRVPRAASAFAHWVQEEYPSAGTLVDLGSGTARDATWFAGDQGRHVLAVDYATRAGNVARRKSRRQDLDLDFELLNLYDLRAVLSLGARLSRTDEPVDLYGRFLLHALTPPGQENVVRLASMALRRGGHLFLEFRTPEDADAHHVFDNHASHYPDPDEVTALVESTGGTVVRRLEGTGLAVFEDEDPHVCRLVARWSADTTGPAAARGTTQEHEESP